MPERYVIGSDRLRRALRDLSRKQLPFATSLGLTRTAQLAARDVTAKLPQTFDRPTPFTQRALGTQRATKNTQSSAVFIKRVQAQYLGIQIKGGTRTPKNRRLVAPANVRRNRYGNLTRNKVKTLLTRKDHFSAEINGVEGIWQRRKRKGLKLVIAYKRRQEYRKRFDFEAQVKRAASDHIVLQMQRAARIAFKTAR